MEVIRNFEAQNIFDFIFDSQLLQVSVLKTQKNAVFRFSSVKKGLHGRKPSETFVKLIKIYFINFSSREIFS